MIINFVTVSSALVAGLGFSDKRLPERLGRKLDAYVGRTESKTWGKLWKMSSSARRSRKDVDMKCRRGRLKARTPRVSAGRLNPAATTQNQPGRNACIIYGQFVATR